MTGKRIDNSSFTKGATRGKPGRALTRWQKKPHFHRALIRVAVLWPLLGISALAIYRVEYALLALACLSVPLGFLTYRKGRFIFFDPFATTDVESGVSTQHWILKNKWRHLFRMQPHPGYIPKRKRVDLSEFPPEVEETLRKAINAENPGGPPALKVTPYKRKSIK